MTATHSASSRVAAALLLVTLIGCSHAGPPPVMAAGSGVVGPGSAAAIATAERQAKQFAPGDVEFMSGMIPHHAQAVVMSLMCESHGARQDVARFCEKIVLSQRGEIRLMQKWLRDRGQEVPDSISTRHVMKMGSTVHEMLMPGMLTDEQMAALDAARGSVFDRLFLVGMIGHHRGALDMVETLFKTPGAGQEAVVFRFASDAAADQAAEIDRMMIMLETVPH